MEPLLAALPVLVVDCQSTGATPGKGSLLELGWARLAPTEDDLEAVSELVALPEGVSIPTPIRRITGIDEAALEGARPPEVAFAALAAEARAIAGPTVIHYAQFERRWLEDLHGRAGEGPFPFDILCTHEIAARLYPDLPRRGLRALAGYLGAPVTMLRRSAEHVRATAFVWRRMVEALSERGVTHRAELGAWLEATPRAKPIARGWPMPPEAREGLPEGPGVYRMRRIDGSLLYVGKARSLRRRVRSYFQKRTKIGDRTLEMLTQAQRLDVTPTETALEAALLELDEIQGRAPPYNVALRALDREGAPRRCVWARADLGALAEAPDAHHPFGPFPDPRVPAGFPALVAALEGEAVDPALALGLPPRWAPEEVALRAGVEAFRARYPEVPPRQDALLAIGRARYRVDAVEPDDEAEDEEPSAGGEGWTAEGVAATIEGRLVRLAHAIRRGRWLAVLVDASVAFDEGGGRRLLRVEAGRIVERGWLDEETPPPPPPGPRRGAMARRADLDLAAHDRLRVLTTELRRVLADGGAAEVRPGPGAGVGAAGLARLLALV